MGILRHDDDDGGSLKTYMFALAVSGIRVREQDNDALLAAVGCDDAIVLSTGGETHVVFYRTAQSPQQAVWEAISQVERAFPDALICRLDRDLVSTSDIAERVGRTRQAVGQWVTGVRGPGGFPAPQGVVGDGIRVWDWASVHAWLLGSNLDITLDDDAFPVPSDVAVVLQHDIQVHTRRVQAPAHPPTAVFLTKRAAEAHAHLLGSLAQSSAVKTQWVLASDEIRGWDDVDVQMPA